jgi:hypothetical protein
MASISSISFFSLLFLSSDIFSTSIALQFPPGGFEVAIGALIGAACFVTMIGERERERKKERKEKRRDS